MSKRLIFALVLMALALFGLSACTPCDMVSPGLVSPDWREILDPKRGDPKLELYRYLYCGQL